MGAVIARTDRLLLRELSLADSAALGCVFGDAEVMRFGNGVQDESWVRGWLRDRVLRSYEQHGFGPYGVVERQHGELIGYCGMFFFPDLGGRPEVELGYRLARAAWGRGLATEAATAVRDHATGPLGVRRLVALIDPANGASLRVAAKLGMVYEREIMLEGYDHPDHLYALEIS